MGRNRAKSGVSEYQTFSFKCHKEKDKDLIIVLEKLKQDRSKYIRDTLRVGARLPRPADPKTIDLETLRVELNAAVDTILANLPTITFGPPPSQPTQPARQRTDVNNNGKRIPDF